MLVIFFTSMFGCVYQKKVSYGLYKTVVFCMQVKDITVSRTIVPKPVNTTSLFKRSFTFLGQ